MKSNDRDFLFEGGTSLLKYRACALPSWLDGGTTDVPGYSLEVTMGGKTHKVGVIAPGAFRDKKLQRFTSVWVAVCRKMSPKFDDGAPRDLQERS